MTYLDSSGSDVAVVREPSGEGGSIVEGVFLLALRELELLVECVNVVPVLENLDLLVGEAGLVGN